MNTNPNHEATTDPAEQLFAVCDQFARLAVRDAVAHGIAVDGTKLVVVNLDHPMTTSLAIKASDGTTREICRCPAATMAEQVEAFLRAGLANSDVDSMGRYSPEASTMAIIVPLDGGFKRLTCVIAARENPLDQQEVFSTLLDDCGGDARHATVH